MTDSPAAPALTGLVDPDGTPVDATAGYPLWMREPAKIVGWIVTAIGVLASGVTFLLSPDVLDVLPKSWAVPLRAVIITAAAVTIVVNRFQTWLTRNGLGAPGNGKDGVFSPAAVAVTQQAVAQEVAAQKNVDPATHAQ